MEEPILTPEDFAQVTALTVPRVNYLAETGKLHRDANGDFDTDNEENNYFLSLRTEPQRWRYIRGY